MDQGAVRHHPCSRPAPPTSRHPAILAHAALSLPAGTAMPTPPPLLRPTMRASAAPDAAAAATVSPRGLRPPACSSTPSIVPRQPLEKEAPRRNVKYQPCLSHVVLPCRPIVTRTASSGLAGRRAAALWCRAMTRPPVWTARPQDPGLWSAEPVVHWQ